MCSLHPLLLLRRPSGRLGGGRLAGLLRMSASCCVLLGLGVYILYVAERVSGLRGWECGDAKNTIRTKHGEAATAECVCRVTPRRLKTGMGARMIQDT